MPYLFVTCYLCQSHLIMFYLDRGYNYNQMAQEYKQNFRSEQFFGMLMIHPFYPHTGPKIMVLFALNPSKFLFLYISHK